MSDNPNDLSPEAPSPIGSEDLAAQIPPPLQLTRFQRWGWPGFITLCIVAWVLYVVVTPATMLQYHQQFRAGKVLPAWLEHPLPTMLSIRTFELLAILWFVALGASIGSFLNVVAWRLPRGRGVIFGKSACPQCNRPIRALDNLPILGWLRLQGHCRSCRIPIHLRYVAAEAVLGTVYLWFVIVELLSGGWNLPYRPTNSYTGVLWILLYTKWDLVTYYAYHMILLSSLFALLLMERESLGIPWKFRIVSAAMGILVAFALPWVPLVGAMAPWSPSTHTHIEAALGLLAGCSMGCIVGWVINFFYILPNGDAETRTLSAAWLVGWVLIGLFLGWQATWCIAGIWWLTDTFTRVLLQKKQLPSLSHLFAATILHHTFWKWCIEW